MIQRKLVLKNFKNLGVSKLDEATYELSDKEETLIIGTNYKQDAMGGLVIIIGENNTGKSNVNKALAKFSYKDMGFSYNDKPNYIDYNECEPELQLILQDNDNKVIIAGISQEDDNLKYIFCNEQEVLRFAIKIYADFLSQNINNAEIKNIVDKSKETKDIKQLYTLYSKLADMQQKELDMQDSLTLEAQYKKELDIYNEKVKTLENVAFNVILGSSKDIFNEFDDIIRDYNVFNYTNNQTYYTNMYADLKNKININTNYEDIRKYYEQLKQLITESIVSYNQRNHFNEINTPEFIALKDIDKEISAIPKPIRQETAERNVLSYANLDDIINHLKEAIGFDKYIVEYLNNDNNMPTIIDYKETHISNKDLMVELKDFESSIFFKAFLNAINKKPNGILSVYEKAKNTTIGYLTTEQEGINKRVETIITKRFNELYGKSGDDAYRFDIRLDENKISLSIFKGKDVVVLDDQSNGFKWFFNIYFNLLNAKILKEGDIVLMDEPAHNLSPKARKECATFLREYGIKHGISFIIVTHDVFWVDSDYLNDLRIIKNRQDKELKGASIINDFSRIESSDTDTFLDIKRAFGVDVNVFYPPNTRLIFVEGITDYNYLTTFKILQEREKNVELHIAFLPICGIGKKGEEQIILEKLMKQSDSPILLVDSDAAGKAIKELKEKNKYDKLEIIILNEICKNFKNIEDLFHENDKSKYKLKVKSSYVSNAFKKHILCGKYDDNAILEKTTKENFYKVIDYLKNDI